MPKPADFRFSHRLRVRWSEVDMQKIVFNGHYLMYLDTAVADYWRSLGMPYHDAMAVLGGDLYVKTASLTYHASAQYDDVLQVGLRCAHIGNSSMRFEGGIFHSGRCLVEGSLLYVYANPATQTSLPVPEVLRQWLMGFEAGETMTACSEDTWAQSEADISALRQSVFHAELGIAQHLLNDESDAHAVHAVVRNRMHQAIAAGRLLQTNGHWHIGRMAVHRSLRGSGAGAQVVAVLEEAARQRQAHEITLSAMTGARAFYERLGYSAYGDEYIQAGLPHVDMRKVLA